jgi:hypothetical protein
MEWTSGRIIDGKAQKQTAVASLWSAISDCVLLAAGWRFTLIPGSFFPKIKVLKENHSCTCFFVLLQLCGQQSLRHFTLSGSPLDG